MEERSLFGGAILCSIPSTWGDISLVRQVPDTQECFLDLDGGTLFVVECLERQSEVADDEAASFFFQDLADTNKCATDDQLYTAHENTTDGLAMLTAMPSLSSYGATACLGSGYQNVFIGKDRDLEGNLLQQEVRSVQVELCVLRLPRHETDILLTLSIPIDSPPQYDGKKEFSLIFQQILASFQIRNWSLFGE